MEIEGIGTADQAERRAESVYHRMLSVTYKLAADDKARDAIYEQVVDLPTYRDKVAWLLGYTQALQALQARCAPAEK